MAAATPQIVLALRWYLAVQAFGLAALPLCLRLFRHLPDRGYGLSKPLGLLLAGWVFWLLVSLGWLRNTAGGVLAALALLAIASLVLYVNKQPAGRLPWRAVVVTEVVFTLAFAAWCVVRAHMPRIETAGGEKWMEIAFLRAILRSDIFPPHDPWLSGFAISYYYFGYVIVAMVTRLTAILPSIAFNLGIATLFALTCTGAFSLVYNLIAARNEFSSARASWLAVLNGLLGPLLVALTGNLEMVMEMLHARGIGSPAFWEWVDVRALAEKAPPLFAEGNWMPTRFFWWWQASRVVRDYSPLGDHLEIIDEFPAFSFLLGDMHPHVLGLPFVLLAIALALNLYLRISIREPREVPRQAPDLRSLFSHWPFESWEFLICAICLGGLWFLNAWDLPIYLFVFVAAYAIAHLRRDAGRFAFYVLRAALMLISLFALGVLLYYPFWRSFQSQVGGVLPNLFGGTRLSHFLLMFGPLLFVVAAYVVDRARGSGLRLGQVAKWTLRVLLGVVVALALIVGLIVLVIRAGVIETQGLARYVDAWLRGEPLPDVGEVPGLWTLVRQRILVDPKLLGPSPEDWGAGVMARAVLVSPVWVVLGLIAFLVAVVFVLRRSAMEERPAADTSGFVLLLFATGALLTLGVEFVYIKDFFGTRMNTVFKFYFQTWALWGIGGAYVLVGFVRRVGTRTFAVLLGVVLASCFAVVLTDSAITPFLLAKVDLPAVIYVYGAGFLLAWVGLFAAFACVAVALARQGGVVVAGTLVGVVILVVAGLLYPVLAISARADEYGGPVTLDGAAYLAQSHPADYAAIAWLNEHVSGAPVIVETPGGSYAYEGRVSAHTGLPTVLGWAGHEHQWRGTYDEQSQRREDISTLYTSMDVEEVLTLLDKYDIRYVYVGPLERDLYPAAGLAKFAGLMETVYDSGGVVIYKR